MQRLFALPRRSSSGQSIVEFALVLPLLVVLLVGIIDLARIYTTMLSVESAAREAADYGTFGSQKWAAGTVPTTVAEMERRACVASSNLPDYAGDAVTCTNPAFSYCLSPDQGGSCVGHSEALQCDNATREPPCRVTVTLSYDFDLMIPLNLEVLGVRYGLPSSLTFQRSSTFPMTDLSLNP